jgi:hypothetical protein
MLSRHAQRKFAALSMAQQMIIAAASYAIGAAFWCQLAAGVAVVVGFTRSFHAIERDRGVR